MTSALELLLTNGYERTTYSAIARTAQAGQSLVQYYMPKKECIVALFVKKLVASIDEFISYRIPDCSDLRKKAITITMFLAELQRRLKKSGIRSIRTYVRN